MRVSVSVWYLSILLDRWLSEIMLIFRKTKKKNLFNLFRLMCIRRIFFSHWRNAVKALELHCFFWLVGALDSPLRYSQFSMNLTIDVISSIFKLNALPSYQSHLIEFSESNWLRMLCHVSLDCDQRKKNNKCWNQFKSNE